jgi:hypothetical protein
MAETLNWIPGFITLIFIIKIIATIFYIALGTGLGFMVINYLRVSRVYNKVINETVPVSCFYCGHKDIIKAMELDALAHGYICDGRRVIINKVREERARDKGMERSNSKEDNNL